MASVVMLSCAVAAGVVFCVAVAPLLSLAVVCAALFVVSVLFVAELLAELLTVAEIIGVCAPQAGTTPIPTKAIAKRMGVKRNSEWFDTLDWVGL